LASNHWWKKGNEWRSIFSKPIIDISFIYSPPFGFDLLEGLALGFIFCHPKFREIVLLNSTAIPTRSRLLEFSMTTRDPGAET
jgi:hypothetical protein